VEIPTPRPHETESLFLNELVADAENKTTETAKGTRGLERKIFLYRIFTTDFIKVISSLRQFKNKVNNYFAANFNKQTYWNTISGFMYELKVSQWRRLVL
jgi:hypothetical protein